MAASYGINPNINFKLQEVAADPEAVALFDRNLLVLAGALIGFLVGILFLHNRPVLRRRG